MKNCIKCGGLKGSETPYDFISRMIEIGNFTNTESKEILSKINKKEKIKWCSCKKITGAIIN